MTECKRVYGKAINDLMAHEINVYLEGSKFEEEDVVEFFTPLMGEVE